MLEEMKKLKEKVCVLIMHIMIVRTRDITACSAESGQGGAGSSDEEELTPEEKRTKKQTKLDRRAAHCSRK
jgi:hypothetical protein